MQSRRDCTRSGSLLPVLTIRSRARWRHSPVAVRRLAPRCRRAARLSSRCRPRHRVSYNAARWSRRYVRFHAGRERRSSAYGRAASPRSGNVPLNTTLSAMTTNRAAPARKRGGGTRAAATNDVGVMLASAARRRTVRWCGGGSVRSLSAVSNRSTCSSEPSVVIARYRLVKLALKHRTQIPQDTLLCLIFHCEGTGVCVTRQKLK